MKKIGFILFCFLIWPLTTWPQSPESLPSSSIDHSVFSQLLKLYVDKNGLVDYRKWRREKTDQEILQVYLDDLSKMDGSALEPLQERMAYWLNLYNGLVIAEILKRPTIEATNRVPHFFDEPRYTLAGFEKKVSLLDIEQYFRDRLPDPRLHLVRVSGALSGPPLLPEAYQAATVEKKVEEVIDRFLKDPTKGRYHVASNTFIVSPIFLWFEQDFERLSTSVKTFIEKRFVLPPRCRIQYSNFNWRLNDTKNR